jgi:hypothetical protein
MTDRAVPERIPPHTDDKATCVCGYVSTRGKVQHLLRPLAVIGPLGPCPECGKTEWTIEHAQAAIDALVGPSE